MRDPINENGVDSPTIILFENLVKMASLTTCYATS
jgi:hypothetical protein